MASSDASLCDHNGQRAKARQPIFTGLSMEDLENWLRQAVAYNSVCHFALKIWALCHACTVVSTNIVCHALASLSHCCLHLLSFEILYSAWHDNFPQTQTYTLVIRVRCPSIPMQFLETFGCHPANILKSTTRDGKAGHSHWFKIQLVLKVTPLDWAKQPRWLVIGGHNCHSNKQHGRYKADQLQSLIDLASTRQL